MSPVLRRALSFWFLALALASAGCSSSTSAERTASDGRGGRGGRGPQLVPVAAAEARPRDLAKTVTVSGPVEPIRSVPVHALAAGTIERVLVEEGARVRPGQLLAQLDAREISAQQARAQALLERAEAEFQRAEQLRARELNSVAELDAARAAFATAKADAQLMRTRLDFTRVTAPIAGVVTAKHVERGGAVSANDPMFEIADDATLVVRVRVSEMDVVNLAPGAEVAVELDAYPDRRVPARIRRIFPSADAQSRLVPVEIALARAPAGMAIRPGYLARVELSVERRSGVVAIPAAAVGVSEGRPYVYVIEADTLVRRPVETGLTASGWVEVTRGLASGEKVVSSGHMNLRPGAAVRVSEQL
jgi:membrane fusion protein, multidrug efflux system